MSGEITATVHKKAIYDRQPIWPSGKDSQGPSEFGTRGVKTTQPYTQQEGCSGSACSLKIINSESQSPKLDHFRYNRPQEDSLESHGIGQSLNAQEAWLSGCSIASVVNDFL